MNDKVLTVSVAAYNVERYLDKLLGSVITLKNRDMVEVLIIDDGSKDKTGEVAISYHKQYPDLVRYIRKENGGHGSTINSGIKEAKGRYFRALDGDDWLDTRGTDELIERLVREEHEADVILTDFQIFTESGQKYECLLKNLKSGKSYSFEELETRSHSLRYHSVIYRTSLIRNHNLTLDEHRFFVDSEYVLFPVPYINKIRYYNLFVYCYRVGHTGQSVSREGRMRHISDSKYVSRNLIDFYLAYTKTAKKAGSTDNNDYYSKSTFIRKQISEFCIGHLRAMMSLPISKENHEMIREYDAYLKLKNPEIFDSLNSRRDIRLLRSSGSFGYFAGHILAGLRDYVMKKSVTGKSTGWKKKLWKMWE